MSKRSRAQVGRGITTDILFVGVTRPAMALGVPYVALLVNAFVTLEVFLVSQNLLTLLLAVPLHAIAWVLCLVEPRFFELVAVWGSVRARAGFRGTRPWRAVSYGPFSGSTRDVMPCMLVVESGGLGR